MITDRAMLAWHQKGDAAVSAADEHHFEVMRIKSPHKVAEAMQLYQADQASAQPRRS